MSFSVKSHKLLQSGAAVKYVKSIFSSGVFTSTPKIVVMHFTYGASAASSANWFKDPANPGSSAQIVIDRDGSVIQCVDLNVVSWHAGKSKWKGVTGLNRRSIGIELANWGYLNKKGSGWESHTGTKVSNVILAEHVNGNPPGKPSGDIGWEAYPAKQIEAAVGIVQALVTAYGINEIVGHDDISKGRKWDPGPAFDKVQFINRVFGTLSSDDSNDYKVTAAEGLNLRDAPASNAKVLKLLPANTIVEPLGMSGKWMNVNVLNAAGQPTDTGYVHSAFLDEV